MKPMTYLRRHKKNDNTAYAIGGMASVLTFLIVGIFGLSLVDHYLLRSTSLASVISAVLVDLANGDRGAYALHGLSVNPVLTAAAQAKADDMAAHGYFAHVSPEGQNSWYWFKQAGYSFMYAGENLAVDFSDSADVERAWMDSPTHRANILDGHFTEIGIATAQGTYRGHPTTFVVQMFGTPAKPTAPTLATIAVAPVPSPVTAPTATTAATALVLGTGAGAITAPSASWWQHLLASPKSMLNYAYYALAGIILVLLAFVTEFEFHRRHLRHVTAAAFLFMFMAGLFTLANLVFFSKPVIAATPDLVAAPPLQN